jgi:BirA family biotin operon repressor/biotin-[acetyl-CoA-carboxylase] ligase
MGGRSQVVVGVGLNIRPWAADGLNTPPAALTELLPELTAPDALGAVAWPLIQTLKAFEAQGFVPLQKRFAARDVLQGRAVYTSDGQQGVSLGVGPGGALRLQTELGVEDIHSAEISVRPKT